MLRLKKLESALLFLTILFLPTQLGKHFWPQFSFIYSLPIDYLSPTLYFWDLLVVSLCVVFILQNKHINRLALNLLYFFMLTQAASLLGNKVNVGAGFIRLEQYLIAGLFGVYVASVKFKVQSSKLYWPLLLAVVLESILAIAQFIKGGTLGLWILGERSFTLSTPGIAKFDFYGAEFLRPYATFPHPNTMAGFFIIAILILTSIQIVKSDVYKKIVILFGGLVVFLTVSRVAIVAGMISALTLSATKGRILLICLMVILLPVLYTRFSSILNFDNLTLLRREELSYRAVNLWLKSPFFGVGLNNFIPAISNQILTGPSRFLQPVHNIFLLSLSETGLLGLVGLLVLLGYPIFKLFRLFRLQPATCNLQPLFLAWGMLVFLGMFDHYFLTLPQGYRLLFLLWGLSFSLPMLK